MPWPFFFHVAVDMFILLALMYIMLVLLQFRRRLYPPAEEGPNYESDSAHEDKDDADEQTDRTRI